jgi:Rps23 Pro-64 3,4-dihydroxylase Tpa1-like proline 4-hydroxylase
MPGWNMLSLFRVPQRHQVTLVSPWASRPRHAITGWWLAR